MADNVYEGGKSDERVSSTQDTSPFRRRYRKLTDAEVNLHDRIKDKATELWALYDEIAPPGERSDKARDVNLARTALEDSVMRAVRGLTG